MESFENRHLGLEQEFFLVDEEGLLSDRADDLVAACKEIAASEEMGEDRFAPECVLSTFEIKTPPVQNTDTLAAEHLAGISVAIRASRGLGLRLYPLATYPLPVRPTLRAESCYLTQSLVMGPERFRHAGRCAGVHLHLELPEATLEAQIGVAPDLTEESARELLGLYNLATALDPAIVALTRSCPFYEGKADGLAARTAHYRGDPFFAPHGLYAALPEAGGLMPYASAAQELSRLQWERHMAWISAVREAGLDSSGFEASGPLDSAWNPVRLNAQGGGKCTVELRGLDSSYPREVMAACGLIEACAARVRAEALTVVPAKTGTLEVRGQELRVPAFERLSGSLLREAATRGVESPEVNAYLDSVLEFAGNPPGSERLVGPGGYRNVERGILLSMPGLPDPQRSLEREEGLALVRAACDELERQVDSPRQHREAAEAGLL